MKREQPAGYRYITLFEAKRQAVKFQKSLQAVHAALFCLSNVTFRKPDKPKATSGWASQRLSQNHLNFFFSDLAFVAIRGDFTHHAD